MKAYIMGCNNVMIVRRLLLIMLYCVNTELIIAQDKNKKQDYTKIELAPFSDNSNHWYGIAEKDRLINPLPNRPRFKPNEIENIADNILLFQKSNGGWAKNYDVFAILTDAQKDTLRNNKDVQNTTFDNGTCYTQIAALAIAYNILKIEKYKEGAIKGIDYILKAQYNNGGWPQYFPLENNYSRHITYNDGAMGGVMKLLKDIIEGKPQYNFVNEQYRVNIKNAFEKGLDCIVKTQIIDGGKLTAWCQQHDEITLQPAWARKFEPPSICSSESADLVLFLMSIEHPSKAIINAIQGVVLWFQESKIYNTRVNKIDAIRMETPFKVSTHDRVVITDSTAPPIWTRYYELITHKPIFCNRDSKVVYSLSEVTRERRDGYSWYEYQPQKVLKSYSKWQKKWASEKNVLSN